MDKMSLLQSKLSLESRIKSSANWFYWIAGLSLINTIILFTGGRLNFIFGLGITQIIDSLAYYIAGEFGNVITYVAVAIDVFIACIFILIGKFAGKKKKWVFIVGIVLFALDGALFLLWSDYLSIAFHAYAIYSIYLGIPAMKRLEETEKQLQELAKEEENNEVSDAAYTIQEEEAEEEVIEEIQPVEEDQQDKEQ